MRNPQDVGEELVSPDAGLGADAVLEGPDGGLFDSEDRRHLLDLGASDLQCRDICFAWRETHRVYHDPPVIRLQRQGRQRNTLINCCRIDGPLGHVSTLK